MMRICRINGSNGHTKSPRRPSGGSAGEKLKKRIPYDGVPQNFAAASSRILYLRILPAAFMGKASMNCT